MTKHITKADPVAWKQAFAEFQAAKECLDTLAPAIDDPILRVALDEYYESEYALLIMPAPDLGAVIDKLMVMWEEEIEYELTDSAQKRVVLNDLRRIGVFNSLL